MPVSRFIIIDDDPLNNRLCRFLISKVVEPGTEILDFISAGKALAYIANTYNVEQPCSTVLLLDINMPDINGWEFLAFYEKLPKKIQEQIAIYIHSSSLDDRDVDRAIQNPFISDFILKPLSTDKLVSIIEDRHPVNVK